MSTLEKNEPQPQEDIISEQEARERRRLTRRTKPLVILAAIFIALVAVYGVTTYLRNRPVVATTELVYTDFAQEAVDLIHVRTGDEDTVLKKVRGQWFTDDDVAADDEAITALLETMHDLTIIEVASENAVNYKNYGVDTGAKNQATTLTFGIETSPEHYSLIVGKVAPDHINTYVRKTDDTRVLSVKGTSLPATVLKTDWRSKKLITLPLTSVTQFSIAEKSQPVYRFAKDGEASSLEQPSLTGDLNLSEVHNLLVAITSLKAVSIIEKPADLGTYGLLPERLLESKIEASDGTTTQTVTISRAENGTYYAKRGTTIYQVPASVITTTHVDETKLIVQKK